VEHGYDLPIPSIPTYYGMLNMKWLPALKRIPYYATLAQSVAEMCVFWYESIDEMHGKLFDGSDDSIWTLDNLFKDGKLMQNGYEPLDDLEIQAVFSKALYALLIPQAWSLSPGLGVVVIDAQVSCGTIEPLKDDVSTEDGNASWVCYKDRMYFLLAASGEERDCTLVPGGGPGSWDCISNKFSLPPGLKTMDGKAWAGLTKEELVQG